MRTVFCPNPACPRGLVWSGSGRPSRPIGKCPDCGRTTSIERPRSRSRPEQLDRERAVEDTYRQFSGDGYDAAWGKAGPAR